MSFSTPSAILIMILLFSGLTEGLDAHLSLVKSKLCRHGFGKWTLRRSGRHIVNETQ